MCDSVVAMYDSNSLMSLGYHDLLLSWHVQWFFILHCLLLVKQGLHWKLYLLQLIWCVMARFWACRMVKGVEILSDWSRRCCSAKFLELSLSCWTLKLTRYRCALEALNRHLKSLNRLRLHCLTGHSTAWQLRQLHHLGLHGPDEVRSLSWPIKERVS